MAQVTVKIVENTKKDKHPELIYVRITIEGMDGAARGYFNDPNQAGEFVGFVTSRVAAMLTANLLVAAAAAASPPLWTLDDVLGAAPQAPSTTPMPPPAPDVDSEAADAN